MSRPRSTKEIPPEISIKIKEKLANRSEEGKPVYVLKQCLVDLINSDRVKYYEFRSHFAVTSPSVHTLSYALRKSKPYGSQELRNLLCLFISDGKYRWNGYIKKHMPDRYEDLKDTEDIYDDSKFPDQFLEESPVKDEIPRFQIENERMPATPNSLHEGIGKYPSIPAPQPLPAQNSSAPVRQISIPGFRNVWVLDESINPTGTHKDRMWDRIDSRIRKRKEQTGCFPTVSIISNGSAAFSIQYFLKKNQKSFPGMEPLRVLVDQKIRPERRRALETIGCKLFPIDLSKKALTSGEILKHTKNTDGIDLTYRQTLNVYKNRYYDSLSCQILDESPDYCFVPFGTGELYANVLYVLEKEYNKIGEFEQDRKVRANLLTLRKCCFMGATTDNPGSKMENLFSHHSPIRTEVKNFVKRLKKADCIGRRSDIRIVREDLVDRAMALLKDHNVNAEESGAAGLALFLQMKGELNVSRDSKVLIINSGKTKYNAVPPRCD